MYGVSATRSQVQSEIRLRPPFHVVWSRGIGSMIEFPAVVWDGVAYIANHSGSIHALSMRSGNAVWQYDTPHGKMAASPAIWRDELVAHGMDGRVWVLDRQTGRLRWNRSVGSPIESSPVVWHGVDYFGTWNGRLYALDLRTGRFAGRTSSVRRRRRARRSPGGRCTSATTPAACGRSMPRPAERAGSAA